MPCTVQTCRKFNKSYRKECSAVELASGQKPANRYVDAAAGNYVEIQQIDAIQSRHSSRLAPVLNFRQTYTVLPGT